MSNVSEPRQGVSLSLRSWIYRSCQFAPIHKLGQSYYEMAARYCAERISDKLGDEAVVIWTGGSTHRCAPGVSDIDLVALVPDELVNAKTLGELRKLFIGFRKAFIPVGEIHLVPYTLWEYFYTHQPAPILWFESQRQWIEGRWRKIDPPTPKISPASRLSLALHHYGRAIRFLFQARGEAKLFYRAGFQREIAKTIRFASPPSLKAIPSILGIEEGLQLAFRALKILEQQVPGHFDPVPLEFNLNLSGSAATRFATEMFHRRVERSLRIALEGESWVDSTSIPLLFTTRKDLEPELKFFELYAHYIQFGEHQGQIPIVVPFGVEAHCLAGWSWGEPFESVSWQKPHHFECQENLRHYQNNLARCLWERLLLETVTMLSKAIGQSRAQSRESARRLVVLCEAMGATPMGNLADEFDVLERYPQLFLEMSETLRRFTPKTSA